MSVVRIASAASREPGRGERRGRAPRCRGAMRGIGSGLPITPVEATSISAGAAPDRERRAARHRGRVATAALAHRDVRAAAVHDHAAREAAAHAAPAQLDRRAHHAGAREDARHRGGRVAHQQREVEAAGLDARAHPARPEAGDPQPLPLHPASARSARALTPPRNTSCTSCRCRRDRDRCGPTLATGAVPRAARPAAAAGPARAGAAGPTAGRGDASGRGAGAALARRLGSRAAAGSANLNTISSAWVSMRAFISSNSA